MASKKTSATRVVKGSREQDIKIESVANLRTTNSLTDKEKTVRKMKKYATTTFGFRTKTAYGSGVSNAGVDVGFSSQGNFYSPQLSTDFLEKPQNLRERRAWYRHFYNSNEFVGAAIDLHSMLPLSRVKLDKPVTENEEMREYVYSFFEDMCNDMKLFKTLNEISHEFFLLGNVFIYAEDHDPYDYEEKEKVEQIKEHGKEKSLELYEKFKIKDKDPNYLGWRKLIVLPPDQVRIRKIPLSADDSIIEFMPDPETKKSVLSNSDSEGQPDYGEYKTNIDVPDKIAKQIREGGLIPLDTDPYSGSYVYHLARKKSQYETLGVSILERCVNTLLFWDKLRQSQTSIASRHMTPIRIVWAEELSETDVEALREQVDLALVDPDFSIITNYQVNWEEMGSGGRLLELSSEYDHIENSLFAGLGVTREILTGEGTYSGSRITLEVMNRMYVLYRELLQEYIEDYLFKPVAKKKGFVEKDKYGREKLLYPKLSFTKLAIKDNDAYFDQVFQLYNKGSVSIDVILDMLGIDPSATKKKVEADIFTVNDSAFNVFLQAVYSALATQFIEKYDMASVLANYLNVPPLPTPPAGAEAGGLGGGGLEGLAGGARFSSSNLNPNRQQALEKLVKLVANSPEKLDKVAAFLKRKGL